MTDSTTRSLQRVLDTLRDRGERFERWVEELVAIPSVSADPERSCDVRRAAEYVAERLREAGPLDVRMLATDGHPAVLASWDGAPGAPTLLIYGHLDVQPAEPLEAWSTDPFALTHRDGRWYGRGVSDDKASMLIPIAVVEAWFADGAPPVNLRFLFEAEEEVGSPHLPALVRRHADAMACDLVISADGGMWRADVPSLTTRSRGMLTLAFEVHGPGKDLHSGRHGGAVANPVHALARIVASLHTDDGRVAIPGFYRGVNGPSDTELSQLAALPFDEAAYLREVGADVAAGEAGYPLLARIWDRPTLEVNGIGGGYQGPGSKTVLPASAFAKLTCRLVAGQDPAAVRDALVAHVHAAAPPGVTVEVHATHDGAGAYRIPADHPALAAAEEVLHETLGARPLRVGMGGSVPVTRTFRDVLGAEVLFFSFSVADENIHAPDEFYRPERFHLGMQAWARLWARLAER